MASTLPFLCCVANTVCCLANTVGPALLPAFRVLCGQHGGLDAVRKERSPRRLTRAVGALWVIYCCGWGARVILCGVGRSPWWLTPACHLTVVGWWQVLCGGVEVTAGWEER